MKKKESIDKLVDILKKGAIKFRNDLDKYLEYYFLEEIKEDEIILHFNLRYERDLEYLIILKKQKTDVNYIPTVKGYNKMDLNSNPFKKLKFTDENEILANIYDYLQEINFDEIVCYQKFGILIRNPLDLTGIYNINIKYITD